MARILIVDDSVVMRRNLKTILTSAGHQVVGEAVNGKQAIAAYSESKPELVTMDITMPTMDGIEALKRIMKDHPEGKIIVISALDQKRRVFEALENGAKHYLIKPITSENLLKIVNEVLIEEDTACVEQAETEKCDSSVPFIIKNNSGLFNITILNNLNHDFFNSLKITLNSFLLIKPLNMIFDFSAVSFIDEGILIGFKGIFDEIEKVNGEYKISAQPHIIEKLKALGVNPSLCE